MSFCSSASLALSTKCVYIVSPSLNTKSELLSLDQEALTKTLNSDAHVYNYNTLDQQKGLQTIIYIFVCVCVCVCIHLLIYK